MLIVKKVSVNSKLFQKIKHFLEECYIEPDLIKKPEAEEGDELSIDEISDTFVPVEGREKTCSWG